MRLTEHAWWAALIGFWIAFITFNVVFWQPWYAALGVLSLLGVGLYIQVATNQRRQIRAQRLTISLLEQQLKEAHRHEPR